MNRQIGTLVTILLIQCAMVVALYWPVEALVENTAADPLINFDLDKIDEISVEDAQGNEVVLLKMANRWLLPDFAGMPVDPAMIDKLTDSLGDRTGQWPIATTDSSRQRFKVASYLYQRRLTFIAAGELLATLYLGTSPGFRLVHARNDAGHSIYRIPFNTYEAPARGDKWLNKRLLQIEQPHSIQSGEYLLSKEGGQWTSLTGVPDSQELTTLLLGLSGLQVEGIADEDTQRSLGIAVPEFSLAVKTADTGSNLSVFTLGENHYIRSDRYDYFFTLSALDFDRLASVHALALIEAL